MRARTYDALVGMDSFYKVDFHWRLRSSQNHTQEYLDHTYNIVHEFRKCHICVLHEIKPKKGEASPDDAEKQVGEPEASQKQIVVGSPDPHKKDVPSNQIVVPSNQIVIGFPPAENECAYNKKTVYNMFMSLAQLTSVATSSNQKWKTEVAEHNITSPTGISSKPCATSSIGATSQPPQRAAAEQAADNDSLDDLTTVEYVHRSLITTSMRRENQLHMCFYM
jgi:hypothetical protein